MKLFFVALILLAVPLMSQAETASPKLMKRPCQGHPNPRNCQIEFFCQEVEPFIIPFEAEVWNEGNFYSLHKFVNNHDGTRTEQAGAAARQSRQDREIIYTTGGLVQMQLAINFYNGNGMFAEKVFGRTIMSEMLCSQPY